MSLSQGRANLFYGRDVATFLRKRRSNLFTAQTWKPFETAETWKPFFQFCKRHVETFSKGFHVSEGQKGFHVTAMEQYRGNLLSKKSLKGFHVSLVHLGDAEHGVALLLLLLLLATLCSGTSKYRGNLFGPFPEKVSPSLMWHFPKKVSPSLGVSPKRFPRLCDRAKRLPRYHLHHPPVPGKPFSASATGKPFHRTSTGETFHKGFPVSVVVNICFVLLCSLYIYILAIRWLLVRL